MKRAVILHGTDGNPTELAWQVWLEKQLEDSGYEVFFPLLPDNHTPDLAKYDEFLQSSGWDFTDNVVIGHSSGATTLLHLLQRDWFPHIRAAVLVGTFLEESRVKSATWYDPGQFDKLFIEEFQPGRIRSGADKFYFVHGDDDPYCDYDLAQQLCEQVDGTFITIPGGGHIASSSGIAELPALTAALTADGLLHSELRQLFSPDGEPLMNGGIDAADVADGMLIGTAHVWIWRAQGGQKEVLLQRRALTLTNHPGMLDISSAGHIDYGESPLQAAVREAEEELGLVVAPDELRLIGNGRHSNGRSFRWMYVYKYDGVQQLLPDPAEVAELKWVSLDEFEQMAKQPEGHDLVWKNPEYYQLIVEAVRKA